MKLCSIDGCAKRAHARGWCQMHYRRWVTTGTTDPRPKADRRCSVEDCDAPHFCKGLCSRHYQRVTRLGTSNLTSPPTVRERIAEGIRTDEHGCWIWQGATGLNGYGRISVNDRVLNVHRVSYETFVGPIPEGLSIDHLCRVRMCINPDHLEAVSLAENTRREMAARKEST